MNAFTDHPSYHMKPVILAYSETNERNIAQRIGMSEYSYYFVLKWFAPVLKTLGDFKIIEDPLTEADAAYDKATQEGRPCVLLSFAPPHRTLMPARCPLIPMVAWEFERIPDLQWGADPMTDWRHVFAMTGMAVTHSNFARQAIQRAMSATYPAWSIPAPVWDRFSARGTKLHGVEGRTPVKGMDIHIKGVVYDSANCIPESTEAAQQQAARVTEDPRAVKKERRAARRRRSARKLVARLMGKTLEQYDYERLTQQSHHVRAKGVIYASILNPLDGRKNWGDIVTAFVSCFQNDEDAVLVLKLNERNSLHSFAGLNDNLQKFMWMKCRVIALNGYLDEDDYDRFLDGIDYVVNASTGEGQCLPLMELMSMGVPAITPNHTSMADYVTKDNAFVLGSSRFLCSWPHDPRHAYTTHAYRISWDELREAYRLAHQTAKKRPEVYREMSMAATRQLASHCSERVVRQALGEVLAFQADMKLVPAKRHQAA